MSAEQELNTQEAVELTSESTQEKQDVMIEVTGFQLELFKGL